MQVRKTVVNLTTGRTVFGDLALSWPWTIRVRNARVIERGTQPDTAVKVDGIVRIPRRSVEFMQVN